jgi:protein-S-isoprenylcysteine O-methyltransferase Ste14
VPAIPPPLYGLAAGVVQHVLAPDRKPSGRRKVAAGALAAASIGLDTAAMSAFRKHHTTVNPLDPTRASSLVSGGPFTITRNPMYVGLAGLLTAHAILRGGWRTALPIVAVVAVIDRLQIPAEEAALERLFGEEYDAYRARVPRWLGLP